MNHQEGSCVGRHDCRDATRGAGSAGSMRRWTPWKLLSLATISSPRSKPLAQGPLRTPANRYGVPLLACAAVYGDEEMTRLLLAGGADPDARTSHGQTCLMVAVAVPVVATVRLLLDAGANVNAVGSDGETPILCAVLSAETSAGVVAALVEAGADLSVRDGGELKKTPLEWAEAADRADLVAVMRGA